MSAPDDVTDLYDRAASSWQSGLLRIGFDAAYQKLAERSDTYAPLSGPAAVLDAGTGTGAMARAFLGSASQPCHFDLLDLSPEMLRHARAGLPEDTVCVTGAVGEAPIKPGWYDRVLAAHVIEHCRNPQAALTWLFQRLKPGGVAVFAVSRPHWCTALVRWKWGNAAFREAQVAGMLSRAGFVDVMTAPHEKGPPSRVSCGYLARKPNGLGF